MCAADPKIKAFLDENVSVYYDRTDDSDTEIIVVKPHSDEEQFNMRYSHVIDELITLPTFATAI